MSLNHDMKYFWLPFSPSEGVGDLDRLGASGDPAAELGFPERVPLKNKFMRVLERWRVTFFSEDAGFSFFLWCFSSGTGVQKVITRKDSSLNP